MPATSTLLTGNREHENDGGRRGVVCDDFPTPDFAPRKSFICRLLADKKKHGDVTSPRRSSGPSRARVRIYFHVSKPNNTLATWMFSSAPLPSKVDVRILMQRASVSET